MNSLLVVMSVLAISVTFTKNFFLSDFLSKKTICYTPKGSWIKYINKI